MEQGVGTDFEALAARCEAATGPDLAINFDIAEFVTRAHMATGKAPAYTASLDAAMTLVPEGCFWAGGDHPDLGAAMTVTNIEGALPQAAKAATPALALCAASLRARANEKERG